MSNLHIKTRIYSGDKSKSYLKNIKDQVILIVCDKFLVESKTISYLIDILGENNKISIFDSVVPDPSTEVVIEGIKCICKEKPSILIGFGGGSAIDTAKAILYFNNSQNLLKKPLFIAIPTTSGTGTEVTSLTVITDKSTNIKKIIDSEDILPDIALLDPQLTVTVPKKITANTGMDVLTHALEAYVAKNNNIFSDAVSEKSVELLMKSLVKCYKDGSDLNSRRMMQEASTLAGIAFNSSGLGINHSIAHQLGATFHIPHGLANALLLNSIIDYNSKDESVLEKYAELSYKLQFVSLKESPKIAVETLKCVIKTMMISMDMPLSVRDIGVRESDYKANIDIMVENALKDRCTPTTPKDISSENIAKILLQIY